MIGKCWKIKLSLKNSYADTLLLVRSIIVDIVQGGTISFSTYSYLPRFNLLEKILIWRAFYVSILFVINSKLYTKVFQ